MRQTVFAIIALIFLTLLVSWVATHRNLEKSERLSAELHKLQAENEGLGKENDALRRRIRALRYDPRVAERRARQDNGLVRPNETVFQFVSDSKPQPVIVILSISNSSALLAGKSVSEKNLGSELDKILLQVPNASLKIKFDEDLDPIRKQMFQDIIQHRNIHISK